MPLHFGVEWPHGLFVQWYEEAQQPKDYFTKPPAPKKSSRFFYVSEMIDEGLSKEAATEKALRQGEVLKRGSSVAAAQHDIRSNAWRPKRDAK